VSAVECPAENTWLRYLAGHADDAIHAHLDGCAECRLVFAELSRSEHALARGAQLGRYVVIDVIGRGGMGIVYKAFDPELDRAIAVKLVAIGADEPEAARQRLLREAKLLAQLSHPNVVAVHDLGTLGDDVFIAMEYVAGVTLRQWLREPRTPAEIIGVLADAARGLAAAHRLAIVHRDFKPENVMVDETGRARVLDFGLARSAGAATDASRAPTKDSGTVTRSGALAGTPHYMAPEQGRAVDATIDQFSFCVVLYEALYGERPVADAQPPSRRGVSSRVRRALQVGLRADPAQRHASMDALIAELRPRRRTQIAVAALALATLGGGVAAAWAMTHAPSIDDACSLSAEAVTRVWNPTRRVELAGIAGEPVAAQVDAWTIAWSARRKELCAQTLRSDDDQSQDIAQQVGCLRRRLTSLDASVSAIIHAKLPELVRDAPRAIERAGSPTVCDSYERGSLDESSRERFLPIFEAIVTARVALEAGKLDAAETAARSAVTAARANPEPDLLAGALGALGLVQAERRQHAEARATLNEAIRLATLAREDKLIVDSWNAILLMGVHGDDKEVDAAIFGAEVAASKLPEDDPSRCMVAARAGTIHARRDEPEPALAKLDKALACWRAISPQRHAGAIAEAQFVSGLLRAKRADWTGARAGLEAAVAHWEADGKPHADLAMALDNLGSLALIAEADAAAERHYRRSLEVSRAIGDDAAYGGTQGHLGYVLVRTRRCADAEPILASARTHQEALHGAQSMEAAAIMVGQAACALEQGQAARAKALVEVAKPIIDGSPAATASTIALADFTLARTLVATGGSKSRAIELAQHALAKLAGHPFAIHRREIEAWLATQR
jgi:serine/threonine protein kinase/tetratricopeptide (TPR) repeat protein